MYPHYSDNEGTQYEKGMKRIVLSAILVLLQSVGHSYIKAQSTHVIEPAVLEVKYNVIYGNFRDTYALRCGKNTSQYINLYTLRCDSLSSSPDPAIRQIPTREFIDDILRKSKGLERQRPQSPGYSDYIYWNLEPNKLSVYTGIFGTKYVVVEDPPTMNWEIDEDTVQTILGYECHKAMTKFRGREWIVWYAEGIPMSLGPWKLNGLPGLILQAECRDYISFCACSLETDGLASVTFYNYKKDKYEQIEREKYLNAKKDPKSYPPGTIMTPQMELE